MARNLKYLLLQRGGLPLRFFPYTTQSVAPPPEDSSIPGLNNGIF